MRRRIYLKFIVLSLLGILGIALLRLFSPAWADRIREKYPAEEPYAPAPKKELLWASEALFAGITGNTLSFTGMVM